MHDLEAKVAKLGACSKHDLAYLARHDVAEAVLFDYAKIRTELETMQTWLEYSTRRAQHVAAGGSPDDPQTKWSK